jgi:hypothetical protein
MPQDRSVNAPSALPGVAAMVPVLAAVWCRSVGATWTVELHKLGRGAALGTTVDWISSGVPTSQPPPPEDMARELLAGRGLQLYPDPTAWPCTQSRHSIGYVCRDAEVITLAHRMRGIAADAGAHPLTLAARWVASRLSPDAGSFLAVRDGHRWDDALLMRERGEPANPTTTRLAGDDS